MLFLLAANAIGEPAVSIEGLFLLALQQPDRSTIQTTFTPVQEQVQWWTGQSSQGYAKALLAPPSPLAILNHFALNHTLLPSLTEQRNHEFVRVDIDSHDLRIGITNGTPSVGFIGIHRKVLEPQGTPFLPERLSPIVKRIDLIAQQCAQVRPFEEDVYGNTVSWKGENCAGWEMYLRYTPADEYPIQAVFQNPSSIQEVPRILPQ